jgi:hypothetical protein
MRRCVALARARARASPVPRREPRLRPPPVGTITSLSRFITFYGRPQKRRKGARELGRSAPAGRNIDLVEIQRLLLQTDEDLPEACRATSAAQSRSPWPHARSCPPAQAEANCRPVASRPATSSPSYCHYRLHAAVSVENLTVAQLVTTRRPITVPRTHHESSPPVRHTPAHTVCTNICFNIILSSTSGPAE